VEAQLYVEPMGAIMLHNKTILLVATDVTGTNVGKVNKVSSS